jgi:ATP-binding cassette subfamily B multidrug efflux pump
MRLFNNSFSNMGHMSMRHPKDITTGQLLLRCALRYKAALAFSLLCILISVLFTAAGPIVLEQGVNHLTLEDARPILARYSLLLVAIAVVQAAAMFGQELLLMRSGSYIERDLRSALFNHLQKMPWEFFQKHSIGELMMRVDGDLTAITGATRALSSWLASLVMLIVILPLMISVSAGLAALAFAPLLLIIVSSLLLQKKIRSRLERAQEFMGKVYSQAHAALSAPRTIRAFTQEPQEIEAFRSASRQYIDHYLSRVRLSSLLYPLLQFFLGLSFIVVLWHGGDMVAAGKLSIGQFLRCILYLAYMAWPMHVLGWEWTVFQRGIVSMGRVHALLSLQPAIRDASAPAVLSKPTGALQFRNVSFRYRGTQRAALDQVSFRVEPGQTVGVMGTVGAGKSTLMNLVPRLLEPSSGEVLIGGCPLTQIPLEALRSSIGYVPQETFLFSDTLAANVAFGRMDAGHDEIRAAAEAAGLADDIAAFPKGYDTIVGERGITLSGGQKQRVSIARTILRNPEILLLDDALSSVDSHTAENILVRVQKLMAGKTCLISSHRVSTLRGADLILVLHDGHIVEQGTHQELLAHGGLYAELREKQLLEEKFAAT